MSCFSQLTALITANIEKITGNILSEIEISYRDMWQQNNTFV